MLQLTHLAHLFVQLQCPYNISTDGNVSTQYLNRSVIYLARNGDNPGSGIGKKKKKGKKICKKPKTKEEMPIGLPTLPVQK